MILLGWLVVNVVVVGLGALRALSGPRCAPPTPPARYDTPLHGIPRPLCDRYGGTGIEEMVSELRDDLDSGKFVS